MIDRYVPALRQRFLEDKAGRSAPFSLMLRRSRIPRRDICAHASTIQRLHPKTPRKGRNPTTFCFQIGD